MNAVGLSNIAVAIAFIAAAAGAKVASDCAANIDDGASLLALPALAQRRAAPVHSNLNDVILETDRLAREFDHSIGEAREESTAEDGGQLDEVWRDVPASQLEVAPPPAPRHGDLQPVIWLHVPKTGSKFETMLIHHACGSKIKPETSIIDPSSWNGIAGAKDRPSCTLNGKRSEGVCSCSTQGWNAMCGEGAFSYFESCHMPLWHPAGEGLDHRSGIPYMGAYGILGNVTDDDLRHVVMMAREPQQRAISGWYHNKHDCTQAASIHDYAQCTKACSATMLVGYYCGGNLSTALTSVAVSRVRSLGFVGLTDHWELSVCLFHAMFGGDCLPAEFPMGRLNKKRRGAALYDVAGHGLENFTEGPDFEVYGAAKEVFWKNVREHGVTASECAKTICPKAADSFDELSEADF